MLRQRLDYGDEQHEVRVGVPDAVPLRLHVLRREVRTQVLAEEGSDVVKVEGHIALCEEALSQAATASGAVLEPIW